MKLSIENHVLRTAFGDKKAIDMIAAAGFDAMDFSFYWMPEEDNFLRRQDYLDYARQIRAWADARGLAITQAHAPFDLTLTDSKSKQFHDYEMIRRSIECAAVMGAEQIIIHNLVTANPEEFIETNLAFYKHLADSSPNTDIRIAVENLWGRKDGKIVGGRLSTPKELSAFLDMLDPKRFCACLDVGHAEIVGVSAAAFIRELGTPKLASLHIQDTDRMSDTHTLPYLGKHDWNEVVKALAEADYQGNFTFEIFKYLNSFPKMALPDALKLAHTIGRGLICEIERAKECKITIAEHYGLRNTDHMCSFLTDFLPMHEGDYPCPSGDTLCLHCAPGQSYSAHAPNFLFSLLSSFPYRETLPSLDDIYHWIPYDFPEEQISECLQWLDKIYALFSSSELTGIKGEPAKDPTDFFISDGKLISCFQIDRKPLQEQEPYPEACEHDPDDPFDFELTDLCSDPLPISPGSLNRDRIFIPDTVHEIGPRAFCRCDRPVHIYMPRSVKKVAEHAFFVEPDSEAEADHRLFFIEHETGDVEFEGMPFNYVCRKSSTNPLVDSSFYFIIAPRGSLAHQFAEKNGISWSETLETAVCKFLYQSRNFEDTRDDAGSFIEVEELYRKGDIAARYAIWFADRPGSIACAYARISFAVNSHIRGETFPTETAVKYLMTFSAEQDYFIYEELSDRSRGFARTAVELMRRNSTNLETALLSLDPDSVAEYIASLKTDPDYNLCWRNMFFDGQSKDYSTKEFFALGNLCARLFITTQKEHWEEILEAAQSIAINLTEEERCGYFRSEDIERWCSRPIEPHNN